MGLFLSFLLILFSLFKQLFDRLLHLLLLFGFQNLFLLSCFEGLFLRSAAAGAVVLEPLVEFIQMASKYVSFIIKYGLGVLLLLA